MTERKADGGPQSPIRRGSLILFPIIMLGAWAIPNSEAAWWHDRIYDGCMLVLDDDRDWECETRLPAVGE